MKTLQKVFMLPACFGFILVMFGLIFPIWVQIDVDLIEMAAFQMKKMPVQAQQQYKALQQQQAEMVKQHPEIPVSIDFRMRCGPYFTEYCRGMVTMGIYEDVCTSISLGDIISMLDMLARNTTKGINGDVADMMESMKTNGWTVTSLKRVYVAIIVIWALVLIQSFVSFVLTRVYVGMKHPRKRLGIAGSVSSFLSGSIMVLVILFVLIVYGKIVSLVKDLYGDAVSFRFPYSIMSCFIGGVLIIVNAAMLTRKTLSNKEAFKYELMVIDTNNGSGGKNIDTR